MGNVGAGAGGRWRALEERKGERESGRKGGRESFIGNYSTGVLGRRPLEEEDFAALESVGQVIINLSKVNLSKAIDNHKFIKKKVLSTVNLHRKYARALTSENFGTCAGTMRRKCRECSYTAIHATSF